MIVICCTDFRALSAMFKIHNEPEGRSAFIERRNAVQALLADTAVFFS